MKRLLLLLYMGLGLVPSTFATPDFSKTNGILISTALPQVVDTSTSPMRLYFIRNNQVLSSTSTDGVTWGEETGVRLSTETVPLLGISSITSCSLLPLNSGGYRMIYAVNTTTDVWRIVSATSTDGLAWANDAGNRLPVSTGTFVGSPRLVETASGDWHLFYLFDSNGGDDLLDHQIGSSLSTDEGLTWSEGSLLMNVNAFDVAVATRTDGQIRLFYTQPLTGSTTASTLLSALSNGSSLTSFSAENNTRLSTTATTGSLSYPVVFRSTESFRYRLLYGFTAIGSTHTNVYTALTSTPDITAISPNRVFRSDPNSSFSISGEIFGLTPTLSLQKSGQTDIPGTGVVRNSDQSLTATFATNSQELGQWNLVVTNPDGVSDTFSNAVNITFRSGEVSLLDNLIRISQGTVTQISVQIFDAGQVTLSLYTMDGKLVNTIFHGPAVQGTTTYTWNGTTAQGNHVASGTYILKADGPKLNDVQKIVVIR